MKLKNHLEIRQLIYNIIHPDENLLSFSSSKTASSAYVILTKKSDEYICFRISDHKTNPYYSNRTFYFNNNLDNLKDNIRDYLNTSHWYSFTYEDFHTIMCLKYMKNKNMNIFIDTSSALFNRISTGMLFYQLVERSRNKKDMHAVSESFQKTLRKLYSSGLISEIKLFDNSHLIYVISEGSAITEHNTEKYIKKYIEQFDSINWNYIEI